MTYMCSINCKSIGTAGFMTPTMASGADSPTSCSVYHILNLEKAYRLFFQKKINWYVCQTILKVKFVFKSPFGHHFLWYSFTQVILEFLLSALIFCTADTMVLVHKSGCNYSRVDTIVTIWSPCGAWHGSVVMRDKGAESVEGRTKMTMPSRTLVVTKQSQRKKQIFSVHGRGLCLHITFGWKSHLVFSISYHPI